jgi:hypothetical protein
MDGTPSERDERAGRERVRLLARMFLLAFGWLASDPESPERDHTNVAGMTCQGLTPEGETCAPCDDCEHPSCRHFRNGSCLDCDREDGLCRS